MVKRLSFRVTLLAIAVMLLIVSCRKESSQVGPTRSVSAPVTIPPGFTDSLWKPAPGPKAIGFGSNGTYYEDQINSASVQGSWVFHAPDSLVITKQFWIEKYRILQCNDTLKLMNVGSNIASYTH